jgi:hypothetical protein
LAGCTQVTAAFDHACALCAGSIACWGDNRHGGLGSGGLTDQPVTTPRTIDLGLA